MDEVTLNKSGASSHFPLKRLRINSFFFKFEARSSISIISLETLSMVYIILADIFS
jgi:hypothetical protein